MDGRLAGSASESVSTSAELCPPRMTESSASTSKLPFSAGNMNRDRGMETLPSRAEARTMPGYVSIAAPSSADRDVVGSNKRSAVVVRLLRSTVPLRERRSRALVGEYVAKNEAPSNTCCENPCRTKVAANADSIVRSRRAVNS